MLQLRSIAFRFRESEATRIGHAPGTPANYGGALMTAVATSAWYAGRSCIRSKRPLGRRRGRNRWPNDEISPISRITSHGGANKSSSSASGTRGRSSADRPPMARQRFSVPCTFNSPIRPYLRSDERAPASGNAPASGRDDCSLPELMVCLPDARGPFAVADLIQECVDLALRRSRASRFRRAYICSLTRSSCRRRSRSAPREAAARRCHARAATINAPCWCPAPDFLTTRGRGRRRVNQQRDARTSRDRRQPRGA